MNFVVEDEEDLVSKLWSVLSKRVRAGSCVGLVGDLGVGKTTFVKGVAKILGVSDVVSSPTFSLARIYQTSNESLPILQHIDLYRIGGSDDLGAMEMLDMVSNKRALTFVEWPNRIKSLYEKMDITVEILSCGDSTRQIKIYEN